MDEDGVHDLKAIPEDDLVVVPRQHTSKTVRNKRAFQKRRRSRACDACRLRKTKCDAPPDGTCSSCASASLLCKFTEPEDERKRIGPTRRLRILEATVQELNAKLKNVEAQTFPDGDNDRDGEQLQESPSIDDESSSLSSTRKGSISTNMAAFSPVTGSAGIRSPDTRSPRTLLSQGMIQNRFYQDNNEKTDRFVGSTSALGFLASVQDYVERLGYDTTSLSGVWKSNEVRAYTASQSYTDGSSIDDLRILLPPIAVGRKLLDIFYYSAVRCLPMFFWPIIEKKFERAYESPIIRHDEAAVTGIFCVLMMINAYSSICSDNTEIVEVSSYNQRRGWQFYECVKKYHDLSKPMYTIADAEVILITTMYLDVAALPSPLWMHVGSLARVLQDLGLHRKPIPEKFTKAESEHRSRMFWYTVLQDRKLALQAGRPFLLAEDDFDMDEPGTYDIADLILSTNPRAPTTPLSSSSTSSSPSCLLLMKQLIAVSRMINPIRRLQVQFMNDTQMDSQILFLEGKLDALERGFPDGMLDWSSLEPLDPVVLKYALLPMAVRFSLYQFFTDGRISRDLRTRCFIRSIEVAKSTVHLLNRLIKDSEWERRFALYQCEMSYHHIFKMTTTSELSICIMVLRAAAPVRPTASHSLQLFHVIGGILGTDTQQIFDKPGVPMLRSNMVSSYKSGPYDTTLDGEQNIALSQMHTLSSVPASSSLITNAVSYADNGMMDAVADSDISSVELFMDGSFPEQPGLTFESSEPNLAGFNTFHTPTPNESATWFSQVNPAYWTLIENVLSHDPPIGDHR